MSGGVDSSVALLLLKKQGWKPIGISLKYPVWQNKKNKIKENVCCSQESLKIASSICRKLGVPYYLLNAKEDFNQKVFNYFLSQLKNGQTPNPCLICNRYLKFKKLFQWAENHHVNYLATGHYAKIRKNSRTKKYELLQAKTKNKDQTYYLSSLPQKWLKKIIFPLANYSKKQVYQIAAKQGFKFFLKRKESQDFCFVSGKSLNYFLETEIGRNPGPIKDNQGNVLGQHLGLHFYTIGQRKGLNFSDGPYFVQEIDKRNNTLIVTKNKKDVCQKNVFLSSVHLISAQPLTKKIKVRVKIRSRQPLAPAILYPLAKGKAKLVFDQPQKAVTPGQFAVFYQKEVCLGNGVIEKNRVIRIGEH